MKADIVSAGATVVAAEKTITGILTEGWTLPGGEFTASYPRAKAMADRIAVLIRLNGGRRVNPPH